MSLFIIMMSLVLSAGAYFLGLRLIKHLNFFSRHRISLWFFLIVLVLLQILGPIFYRINANSETHSKWLILSWISSIAMGLFASTFLYFVAGEGFFWAIRKIKNLRTPPLSLSENLSENFNILERRTFLSLGLFSLASTIIGERQAMADPKVVKVDIPILNLPPELEGFTIAQISDLHIGPIIRKDFAQKVVDITNSLNADIIVLTGDMVDGEVESLAPEVFPLKDLKAKSGVFFVTGNHEYYWNAKKWKNYFKSLGFEVLSNEHRILKNGKLIIAGVNDVHAHRLGEDFCDPKLALEKAPPEAIKILLAHQPITYKKSFNLGYHLQLSGHTHGGQFFPWNIIVKLVQPYYIGLNRHEKLWIYTNRGTGFWGPPNRFLISSEITYLRLVKEI